MSSDIASVRIKNMTDEIDQLKAENAEMRELLNEVASKLIAKNKKLEDYLKKSNPKRCK